MGILYNIACPTGSTYTDKEGVERQNTMLVGRMIENAKGNKMVILDGLPFSVFAKGEPITLWLNEPKPRGDSAPAHKPSGKNPDRNTSDDLTNDIPF